MLQTKRKHREASVSLSVPPGGAKPLLIPPNSRPALASLPTWFLLNPTSSYQVNQPNVSVVEQPRLFLAAASEVRNNRWHMCENKRAGGMAGIPRLLGRAGRYFS